MKYNIPVELWLPDRYPLEAPMLYVRPTPDMIIKPRHSFVDGSGFVRSSYVVNWNPRCARCRAGCLHRLNGISELGQRGCRVASAHRRLLQRPLQHPPARRALLRVRRLTVITSGNPCMLFPCPNPGRVPDRGLILHSQAFCEAFRSNPAELCQSTSMEFGSDPPLFSKPPGWTADLMAAATATHEPPLRPSYSQPPQPQPQAEEFQQNPLNPSPVRCAPV